MKARWGIAVPLALCIMVGTLTAFRGIQKNIASSKTNAAGVPTMPENRAVLGTWVSEDWHGDDSLYGKARAEIDGALAGGRSAQELLAENRSLAQLAPRNPVALFRWAYSASKVSSPTYLSKKAARKGLREEFATVPTPHSYNYIRMRYLLEPEDSHFVSLGERLLSRDRHDTEVKAHLIDDYEGLISISKWRDKFFDGKSYHRALELARDILAVAPTARSYFLLASVHMGAWDADHKSIEAQQAMNAFQQFLRLASPDDEFRPQAIALIKTLQRQTQ